MNEIKMMEEINEAIDKSFEKFVDEIPESTKNWTKDPDDVAKHFHNMGMEHATGRLIIEARMAVTNYFKDKIKGE